MRFVATLALAIDRAGEPPAALHPTVWMGRLIAVGRSRHQERSPGRAFADGAILLSGGLIATAAIVRIAMSALDRLPAPLHSLAESAALKPALALGALLDAAEAVEHALVSGDLVEARRLLSWHLVSRDTSALDASEVAGAAIESIAENLGDSIVGPLIAHRLGGLPAAYVYRFVNTADAMLGYRSEELEWFGKPAARFDDVLSFLPARIAAVCIAVAAPAGRGSPGRAIHHARRDARLTPSPNAGWPMAAMAGALDVHLSKRDAHGGYLYRLNVAGRAPAVHDIRRASRIVRRAAWLCALGIDALEVT